jgi:hypothetical protein
VESFIADYEYSSGCQVIVQRKKGKKIVWWLPLLKKTLSSCLGFLY